MTKIQRTNLIFFFFYMKKFNLFVMEVRMGINSFLLAKNSGIMQLIIEKDKRL